MNVKQHYDTHLGSIYSWMAGDFAGRAAEFCSFLESEHLSPQDTKVAFDLGAGDGAQTYALAKGGFEVQALDFNRQLLEEMKTNCAGMKVSVHEENFLSLGKFAALKPELILCWGDSLTHLESQGRIESFLELCADTLVPGGKLVLSFRDYSEKLVGDQRFIPVKSDDHRILTCVLDYLPTHVMVTDLLHEFDGNRWQQKVSSYAKVRISAEEVQETLENNQMEILSQKIMKGLVVLVAKKKE